MRKLSFLMLLVVALLVGCNSKPAENKPGNPSSALDQITEPRVSANAVPGDLLINSEFASGGWEGSFDGMFEIKTGIGRNGSSRALEMYSVASPQTGGTAFQNVVLNQQTQKNLYMCGWSKATGVNGTVNNDYSLYVDVKYQDGTYLFQQTAQFDVGTHDWQFKDKTIVVTKPVYSVAFHLVLRGNHTAGTVQFDDLCLQEVGNSTNWLVNANLEAGGWGSYRGSSTTSSFEIKSTSGRNGGKGLEKPAGGTAFQRVTLNQATQKNLKICGWSKAINVSGSADANYSLQVDITYNDNTYLTDYISFTTGTHDWEYKEKIVTTTKPVSSVAFHLILRSPHSGTALFDDVCLTEENSGDPTTTFTADTTTAFYNPGRGISFDTNANGVAILPWDASTMTPRRPTVSVYKWDFNVCDGQTSLAACSAMTAPLAGTISSLTTRCNNFRNAGYKVSIKFTWVYGGTYANPGLANYQSVMDAMAPAMQACEDITLMHMMGFGEFSEQWGNFTLVAGPHNSYSYTNSTAVRQKYDSILQKKQACFRRPDYMEYTGIPYPIADTTTYFSTSGSRATCQQQDSPMADNGTEAGTYGVNGNSEAQQRLDDKEHAKWTVKTGEFWEQGISGTNYQNFAAATQYFKDYRWTHIRAFTGNGTLCGNPCSLSSGQLNSIASGGVTLGQWIDRNLGYRIHLGSATLPATITRGTSFNWSFIFGNNGTAAIQEGKLFQLVLKSTGGTVYRFNLWDTPYQAGLNYKNPRSWLPDVNSTASGQLLITGAQLPAGTYNVGLAIPDGESSLRSATNTANYSIRFANTSAPSGSNGAITWDSSAANGINYLIKSNGSPLTITAN